MLSDALLSRLVEYTERQIGAFDFQEALISALFKRLVKTGDVVVDGGAHTGRHTATLAGLTGEKGRVLAVEALPALAAGLQARFSGAGNVTVVGKALSDRPGRVLFNYVRNNPSYSGMHAPGKIDKPDIVQLEVETATLDELLKGAPSCRLMKLDLEGAEFLALRGAEKVLQRFTPLLVFENDLSATAAQFGYSQQQFFGLFERYQYKLFDISGMEISAAHWRGERPHFDNFIAAAGREDLRFVEEDLSEVFADVLLEMNEVSTTFTRQLFQTMQLISSGSKTILFGAGNRARLILEKYPIPFGYAVDNDQNKWGGKVAGVEVRSPEQLSREKKDDVKIVIMSLFADEIENQLLNMGFQAGQIIKIDIR